jgi:hypothetical protein
MAAAFSFSTKQLLQEMFSEMVIKKDALLISHYYHPDFLLETNGQKQDYTAASQLHACANQRIKRCPDRAAFAIWYNCNNAKMLFCLSHRSLSLESVFDHHIRL